MTRWVAIARLLLFKTADPAEVQRVTTALLMQMPRSAAIRIAANPAALGAFRAQVARDLRTETPALRRQRLGLLLLCVLLISAVLVLATLIVVVAAFVYPATFRAWGVASGLVAVVLVPSAFFLVDYLSARRQGRGPEQLLSWVPVLLRPAETVAAAYIGAFVGLAAAGNVADNVARHIAGGGIVLLVLAVIDVRLRRHGGRDARREAASSAAATSTR